MDAVRITLRDIPETLLLPLWGRAEMTRRGSRILSDRPAVDIIDRLDYDFTKIRSDPDESKNLSWIARARQFDDKIRDHLVRNTDAIVVNVGAGLDTTFLRVDDGRVRWFDLDLPEVIALRRQLIPETERARCIAASMFDLAWIDRLDAEPASMLLVAGGVLFYFEEETVRDWLGTLATRLPGAEIVFDAMTPAGITRANQMMYAVGMEDAPLRWGLDSAEVIRHWDARVEVIEQFEYFRGLDLEGATDAALRLAAANAQLGVMTIVHCRFVTR